MAYQRGNIPPKRAFLIENECVVLRLYSNIIAVFQQRKVIYNFAAGGIRDHLIKNKVPQAKIVFLYALMCLRLLV